MRNTENLDKSPEKKSSYPLSFKLKTAFCLAVLGAGFLSSCSSVEERVKANIESAGVPAEIANDPELIWRAYNGAVGDELRYYANELIKQREIKYKQALATQMAADATKQAEDALKAQQKVQKEEVVEPPVALERISQGVFSFVANENIEITSKAFIKRMENSLKETTNTDIEAWQISVAVPDDDFGLTRIFMNSTVESYKKNYGIFYAYPGDTLYVATDSQALTQLLTSQGINYKTFGIP